MQEQYDKSAKDWGGGGKRNIRKVAAWVMQSHSRVSLRVQLRWETKPYSRGTSTVSFIFRTEELPKYKSRDVGH